jgi:hypothetical protein
MSDGILLKYTGDPAPRNSLTAKNNGWAPAMSKIIRKPMLVQNASPSSTLRNFRYPDPVFNPTEHTEYGRGFTWTRGDFTEVKGKTKERVLKRIEKHLPPQWWRTPIGSCGSGKCSVSVLAYSLPDDVPLNTYKQATLIKVAAKKVRMPGRICFANLGNCIRSFKVRYGHAPTHINYMRANNTYWSDKDMYKDVAMTWFGTLLDIGFLPNYLSAKALTDTFQAGIRLKGMDKHQLYGVLCLIRQLSEHPKYCMSFYEVMQHNIHPVMALTIAALRHWCNGHSFIKATKLLQSERKRNPNDSLRCAVATSKAMYKFYREIGVTKPREEAADMRTNGNDFTNILMIYRNNFLADVPKKLTYNDVIKLDPTEGVTLCT